MSERFDVIVVGAGQAGLAVAYHLRHSGLSFLLLDSASEVGASWRRRWDSLRLFTPARYSSLPGLPFPAPPGHYPGKDEVARYLQEYARTFDLPIRLNSPVSRVWREDGAFQLEVGANRYRAAQVVVATGPFQRPFIPALAGDLNDIVLQLHSSDYRNPRDLPAGTVLVVGAGNSGWQIAEEIAAQRKTFLSQGSRLPRVPRRILGRSLFGWLESLGITRVGANTRFGQRMRENDDVVIGPRPSELLRSGRLQLVDRAVGAQGDRIELADGTALSVAAVIWATGFTVDFDWIDVPVFDDRGSPVHEHGVTDTPGLYFVGLRWLHTTGSALLGWVERDAAFLAEEIVKRHHRTSGQEAE